MPVPSDWPKRLGEYIERLKADPNRPLGDDPFARFVFTERATPWKSFLNWMNDLDGAWGFRGQRQSEWLLHPSQDRAVLVEHRSKYGRGYYHLNRRENERDLLFQFRQRAHRYIHQLPPDDDLASWLGLMQHHGVPTRLLDWTHSPYVALYFAIEEQPRKRNKRSAVWAIQPRLAGRAISGNNSKGLLRSTGCRDEGARPKSAP